MRIIEHLVLPTKVSILGFDYSITYLDGTNESLVLGSTVCAATINMHSKEIFVNKNGRSKQEILKLLMHEIVHAIEATFDPHNDYTELTEWQIDMIAAGMASLDFYL